MAVAFNSDSMGRAGALYSDYPENIFIDPALNGRVEVTEIETLAADILKNGQNQPVAVRKDDAGNPVLIYGHRRWRAVKWINDHLKSGEQKVKLICNYFAVKDVEAFGMAIAENRFRKDNTAMDDQHNICLMLKRFKSSLEDIAAIYFPEAKTPEAKAEALRWVKNRASLEELAPEAADGVRKGEIKVTAAVQLAKLSKDQQRATIKAATSTVKGKSRVKVSTVLAAKKSGKAAPAKPPAKGPASVPAPKAPSSVYAAAEAMALAIDNWLGDATEKAEKALIAAHKEYRKLVPSRAAAAPQEDAKAA